MIVHHSWWHFSSFLRSFFSSDWKCKCPSFKIAVSSTLFVQNELTCKAFSNPSLLKHNGIIVVSLIRIRKVFGRMHEGTNWYKTDGGLVTVLPSKKNKNKKGYNLVQFTNIELTFVLKVTERHLPNMTKLLYDLAIFHEIVHIMWFKRFGQMSIT